MKIYIGLGSNIGNELGDPRWHMVNAVKQLADLVGEQGQVRASSLYKSDPMGPQDQPDYLNAVIELVFAPNDLPEPYELLKAVQQIENNAQRKRLRHWGERSLDVDVLVYGDLVINADDLTIPHKGVLERNFVAVPLHELNDSLHISEQPLTDFSISSDMSGLCIISPPHWISKTNYQ